MRRDARESDGARPRVVIVGAGFGGLWAARELAGAPVDVVLLDQHNFHTFYPLLYQLAAAEVDATEIASPVRKILRRHSNVTFRMARVDRVNPNEKWIGYEDVRIDYDHLILATGSDTHFFGVPGAAEHAFPLKEIDEGVALRNHVLACFERADRSSDPEERKRLLTFTIVGGGLTGVEFAGALAELIHGPLARDLPRIETEEISIVVLEMMDGLLRQMPSRLGAYARKRLESMGVDVRLGSTVERIEPRRVHLRDGNTFGTDTVVWTAGVQGDPDAASWGLPTNREGRVRLEPTLQVPGHPAVQVVGDLAGFEQNGEELPMVAPAAMQGGEHAAANILRQLEGREPRPFDFDDPGMLAALGRNQGVAHVYGRTFTGFPAWLLWLGVHIVKLIGFRNRLAVLMNWAWDYFTYERAVRLILPVRRTTHLETTRGREERTAAEAALDPEASP